MERIVYFLNNAKRLGIITFCCNLLIFVFMATGLLACAAKSTTSLSTAYSGETQSQIFNQGKTLLQDRNFGEAIKRFEALDVQYPYGQETQTAQLYVIYAYYMKEEYALSAAAADRFIRLYPTHPHVDYAFYLRGLADYYQNLGFIERTFSIDMAKRDLTQVKKAYDDFTQLTLRFPRSPYTYLAYQYRVYLRNILARHELAVAQYYYQREAYVAAVNRASNVVAHYQGAPSVLDALVLMIKGYRQLGMHKLAEDSLAVLHYNYPDMKID